MRTTIESAKALFINAANDQLHKEEETKSSSPKITKCPVCSSQTESYFPQQSFILWTRREKY